MKNNAFQWVVSSLHTQEKGGRLNLHNLDLIHKLKNITHFLLDMQDSHPNPAKDHLHT